MSLLARREKIPVKDAPPPPKGGYPRVWFLFATNFWKLVSLNLLFLLFSLPVVTVPAAIAALDRVCLLLWREGNCFLFDDFLAEWKSSLLRALPVGLIALLSAGMLVFGATLGGGAVVSGAFVPRILLLAGGCWLALIAGYAFIMLALIRLPVRQILKNALLLTMLEPKRTMLILLTGCAFFLFGGFLLPYTVPLWLFIWFAAWQLCACALAYSPILGRMLPEGAEPAEG